MGTGHRTLPFVGRAGAEELLHSVLAAALTGSGDCVIVEGVAGIGKSRLLAESVTRAAGLGLTVASGRAMELDRIAPLSTLLTALTSCDPPVLRKADLAGLREHQDRR